MYCGWASLSEPHTDDLNGTRVLSMYVYPLSMLRAAKYVRTIEGSPHNVLHSSSIYSSSLLDPLPIQVLIPAALVYYVLRIGRG